MVIRNVGFIFVFCAQPTMVIGDGALERHLCECLHKLFGIDD